MNNNTASSTAAAQVKPPFSLEQLQTDICTIFLLEARKHIQLFDHTVQLQPFGIDDTDRNALWDPANTAADAGITFDKVSDSQFAMAMLDHYDFGFRAVTPTRSEPMFWDSIHTYFGAYLLGLSESPYVDEWLGEGAPDLADAVQRCLQTIELSNARIILEGDEPFYHFSRGRTKDDERADAGELTIRQLAMLAGVEEMSLRSSISRKTPPALQVQKDDRRTFIDAAIAKDWLKAKGRYVPVRKGRSTVGLDLATTSFNGFDDIIRNLADRHGVVTDRDATNGAKLTAALARHSKKSLHDMDVSDLDNQALIADIAAVLDLPAPLLVLRAREAQLKSEIGLRESMLRRVRDELQNP